MADAVRDAGAIEGLVRGWGSYGLPLERVYRLLSNPDLYLNACSTIYQCASILVFHALSKATMHCGDLLLVWLQGGA